MIWPWAAALAGMVGYGVGAIIQSSSAKRHGGPTAMFRPRYLLGILCDALAWIGALIALQKLPLFTVQAILAGSLALIVVLARFFLNATLHRKDLIGIGIAGAGLVIVAASAGVSNVANVPENFVLAMTIGLGVLTLAILAAYRRGAPILLAALSGLAFSGGALGGRALGATGVNLELLTNPIVWLMIAYGGLAIFSFSRALEKGDVGVAMAIMWVVDVIVPGIIGVAILGDTVRPGATIPALIGVGVSIAGCLMLVGTAAEQQAPRAVS